jgi:D-lyxose ketol-isomerase
MKRSEINTIIRDAKTFLEKHCFQLPPFAFWTPEEWQHKGPEVREIVEHGLGWDITDFGSGDFKNVGLFLFTIRNGKLANLKTGKGKVYAEKAMIVGEGQITPMHFHWEKTEDIINRGGGKLVIQLYNGTQEGELMDTDVVANIDSIEKTIKAGDKIRLSPGESITLSPYQYHKFWGEDGRVFVGEVSTVNDDNTDNRFYKPVGRFPDIEEDETPLHLLVGDYKKYYQEK